jgi:hypothetical protein
MPNDQTTILLNEDQKKVWQHEIAYWQAIKNADANNLLALLHSELVIWPSWSKGIMSKKDFEQHLNANLRPHEGLIELKAESVSIFQHTAIIYYLASYQSENIKTDKITHVWLCSNDRWLMIGGTSSSFL